MVARAPASESHACAARQRTVFPPPTMQTVALSEPDTNVVGVVSTQPAADRRTEALDELETQTCRLEEAFNAFGSLAAEEQELFNAYEEAAAEEKAILEDQDASEKQSVERPLKARALKDVRDARLATHRKRISGHLDLIIYDLGEPLRKSFANFAHALLMQKQAEMSSLFYDLLPTGSIPGIDNSDLVRACTPVTRIRQTANWCNARPKSDQAEELAELKQLPRLWLAALRKLLAGEDPFEPRESVMLPLSNSKNCGTLWIPMQSEHESLDNVFDGRINVNPSSVAVFRPLWIHEMIKQFLMISAFYVGFAFGQDPWPWPRLPLDTKSAVNIAKTKAWMIELFQIPRNAKITRFQVVAPGTRVFIMWDTFNDGGKQGHWGHLRIYDFETRIILAWFDIDFMNPRR
jgi:hypothetical protein